MDLATLRKDYKLASLDENQLEENPYLQFEKWMNDAISSKVNEPTAMVLATVSTTGLPSARVVLLKSVSSDGFGFFTNYSSRKGIELSSNPNAALLFHWPELERQVRIEGSAIKVSAQVSNEYFNSRPLESRLSALISNQSQVVPDRQFLERLWSQQQLLISGNKFKRPEFWGGYLVEPQNVEFWQGRANRLHDRILFSRKNESWIISRLAP